VASTYPFVHGITDNGERLVPNTTTLARILKSKGYLTAAFVGGFVMDRRFGLDQGFDTYDSPFALHRHEGRDPGDIKRFGREVVDAAAQWLEQNDRNPFFLFLHLYDLHTPYELSATHRNRFRSLSGYDAELAYVDEVVGAFWTFLEKRRLLDRALVILTSDHGESLGDHGESTHGYFVYQSTLWVPLVFRWPASTQRFPAHVGTPGSLIDVAPTILEFLSIPVPKQFQGRSLLSRLPGTAEDPSAGVYSESLYGYHHFGVSSLRALRVGCHKYIEGPKPELYDLAADPGETRNLHEEQKAVALSLRERLLSIYSQSSHQQPRSKGTARPEELEVLRSLGYLGLRSNLFKYSRIAARSEGSRHRL
jgi:choline-sulfatase